VCSSTWYTVEGENVRDHLQKGAGLTESLYGIRSDDERFISCCTNGYSRVVDWKNGDAGDSFAAAGTPQTSFSGEWAQQGSRETK